MSLKTPVAFLIFKRPDTTERVFQAIRKAKPKKLLVVADGPRTSEEEEKCQQVRAIIEQVDWDCEVLKNYSDTNLGCKKRVSSGLDWVFSEVEEAIILEDDCLPHSSFFRYCANLLERYRYDDRVMAISGENVYQGQTIISYSYYFSKYVHIWGWASWRRAWQYWDDNPERWVEFRDAGLMNSVCDDPYERKHWTNIFDRVFLEGKPDSWDYIWLFTCWSQGGLIAVSNTNLVTNIGFSVDGTHTKGSSQLANLSTEEIGEINYPPFIIQNKEADLYRFDYLHGGKAKKEADTALGKLRFHASKTKRRTIRFLTDPIGVSRSVYRKLIRKQVIINRFQ
jgi:hypothetical protein